MGSSESLNSTNYPSFMGGDKPPEPPKQSPPVYAKGPEIAEQNRAAKLLEIGRKGVASTRLQARQSAPGQLLGSNGTIGNP